MTLTPCPTSISFFSLHPPGGIPCNFLLSRISPEDVDEGKDGGDYEDDGDDDGLEDLDDDVHDEDNNDVDVGERSGKFVLCFLSDFFSSAMAF